MSRLGLKGSLTARIWLTTIGFCQIFLTPMAAFSITYLFAFSYTDEHFTLSLEQEMIPWIITASLAYGLLALLLALIIGGYSPVWVTERGGWRAAIGISRNIRDASALRKSKKDYIDSPHGQLTSVVYDRMREEHGLIATHGGLILLAIPFQLLLVIIPLSLIIFIPDELMRPNRRLEMALGVYLIVLILVMRVFPAFAKKNIALAAFTRRWLISVTRISWLAPVLVLWLLGRIASLLVLSWMGEDVSGSIDLEQQVFENWLNIKNIPETSFLDLLTALAVMPLAAFTTLAALGGGSGPPPKWMDKGDEKEEGETIPEVVESTVTIPPKLPEIESEQEAFSFIDQQPTVEEIPIEEAKPIVEEQQEEESFQGFTDMFG